MEALGAIIECETGAQSDRLTNAYLDIAASGELAIVISQTRAEVRAANDAIRERLRERGFLAGDESNVTALEQVDLTEAQKLDLRNYPSGSVVVFNRDFCNCRRGEHGKIIGLTAKHLVIEVAERVRQIPRKALEKVSVCLPHALGLSVRDKLQLKANNVTCDGRKIANGEIVSVAKVAASGAIRLEDGRVLPPHYRQFQRGYAVTSYGSQGKTVDHVLFSDSGVRAASNAQQWYVTISRGRKSIRIFTPDKLALRDAIARSGERKLALDLIPQENSGTSKRHKILRSIRRGREFARRVCLMTIHSWSNQFLGIGLNQRHENRNSQTNRRSNARVLAT